MVERQLTIDKSYFNDMAKPAIRHANTMKTANNADLFEPNLVTFADPVVH